MSYIVFARKYRPQSFDEIVGQSHITTTLKNALSQDRVAHAYLFAGPRGVGKTTTARILARALDCEKGPTPKPCNVCASCKDIIQGSSLDILEIDGASNRGIDEIRNLRDNVKFSPSKGKFKIYIIDEVHMLTPEAFNALLKTLEEPPPHVKFIFATTQAHKVPPTILSRCQRFDFKRISTKDISENLKKIRKAESLNIDDEAIDLIARHSDGGMRNGQVILDQIMSFAKGKIGPDDVAKILGIIDEEVLFGFSEAIKTKDAAKALELIDKLVSDGKDIMQVVMALIEHFRNISVAKIGHGKGELIDAGTEDLARYAEEAKNFTIEDTLYIIYSLVNTIDFIRKSTLSRIPFETVMIKLTRCGSMASLEEILKRLDAYASKSDINIIEKAPEKAGPASHSFSGVDDMASSWKTVIDHIKNKRISVASYLQEGYPLSLEGAVLTIGFPSDLKFHKETLETPDNKKLIEESLKEVLKSDLKIKFELVEPANMKRPESDDYTQGGPDGGFAGADSAEGKDADPIVKAALEMFGGSIAGKSTKRGGN